VLTLFDPACSFIIPEFDDKPILGVTIERKALIVTRIRQMGPNRIMRYTS